MRAPIYYRVIAFDAAGNPSQASNEASATIVGSLQVASVVFSDGAGTRMSPEITTTTTNTLLLAFVAADGPTSGQTLTVSGAGLTWTRLVRVATQFGASEIWRATAAAPISNAIVMSTPSNTNYHQSLTVVIFSGSGGTGAVASNSGINGAPTVSLTTTRSGSLVYAVGNDSDRAAARTLGSNQTMVHQWVDTSAGDTLWVQSSTAPTGAAGSVVLVERHVPNKRSLEHRGDRGVDERVDDDSGGARHGGCVAGYGADDDHERRAGLGNGDHTVP